MRIAQEVVERRVELAPFSFWEQRSGTGTPVVLLHGLSGSATWWRRNVDALAGEHLVSAIDLVGFGHNRHFLRPGPLPLSFDDIAALLSRWLEQSFGEKVHLVGHSMGGQVALQLASHRPDLIRSLVLVNSTGIPFELRPLPHLRSLYPPAPGAISFSRVVAFDFLRAGPTAVALAALRLFTTNMQEAMSHVSVPTLLVWGERDPLVPREYGERMRDAIRDSELVVIPRAGHITMWESPERFNSEVLSFFRQIESQPTSELSERAGFNWGIEGLDDELPCRASGRAPRVVLLHGLGVSSAYFRPLAQELYRRGVEAIAPDLPGFGFNLERPVDPSRDGEALAAWAERRQLKRCIWVGHSTGCQSLEALFRARPEIVERPIFLSPIWTTGKHLFPRIVAHLPADALMERWGLLAIAVESYWNSGFRRLLRGIRHWIHDAGRERSLPPNALVAAGEHDPFADWDLLEKLAPGRVTRLPGAHGMHYSFPSETADVIVARAAN